MHYAGFFVWHVALNASVVLFLALLPVVTGLAGRGPGACWGSSAPSLA